jgi:hypothetical protein
VSFSADGKRILSGGFDQTVKIWEAGSGQELLTLKGHANPVTSVTISPDGKRIVTGSGSGYVFALKPGEIKVWEAAHGLELLSLERHAESILRVAFSADGNQVFGQDEKGKILAWNANTGQLLPDAPATMPPGGREAGSADGRLQAFLEHGVIRVRLVEAQQQRQARDRERLRRLAQFDSDGHRRQLQESLESGNDFAAAFHAGRLLQQYPWDASLHVRQAHLLARLGKREESATHLMLALFLHPRLDLRTGALPARPANPNQLPTFMPKVPPGE